MKLEAGESSQAAVVPAAVVAVYTEDSFFIVVSLNVFEP